MQKLIIDLDRIAELSSRADEIFFDAEAEHILVELLEAQQTIEKNIDIARALLEKRALDINPNFKSITGDKVKVSYRSFGSKYKVDESMIEYLPKELYKTKTSYSPIPKAIDDWTESHKGLPAGILEPERPKRIVFKYKHELETE